MAGAITTYAGHARRRGNNDCRESAALAAYLSMVGDQWAFKEFQDCPSQSQSKWGMRE